MKTVQAMLAEADAAEAEPAYVAVRSPADPAAVVILDLVLGRPEPLGDL